MILFWITKLEMQMFTNRYSHVLRKIIIENQLSDPKDLMSYPKIKVDNELNEKSPVMVTNSIQDDAPNNKKMKKSFGQEIEQTKKIFKSSAIIVVMLATKL